MATALHNLIPTPKEVLEREPRELAVAVFQVLASLPDNQQELHLYNFCITAWIPYDSEYKAAIAQAVAEAWQILKNEGLIAETSGEADISHRCRYHLPRTSYPAERLGRR